MTGRMAAEQLLRDAMKPHKRTCACVVCGKIIDSKKCDCGATKHNNEVGIRFIRLVDAIRSGEYLRTVDVYVGVEP